MIFKELALKMLKRFPDGIWVHFQNMPDGCRMDCGTYLDADSLDDFEGRLKQEVADYYIDDFGYDALVVTLKDDWKMYEPETNISEEDLELYADYAVEHAAEIAKIIEQAVETNKVRFKEYLIYMIWCDLDDDEDSEITVYYQDYDKKRDKLGELYKHHTVKYSETTIHDYLNFHNTSFHNYDEFGLNYGYNSDDYMQEMNSYTFTYILKDIKKYIEDVFYIQMTDKEFDYLVESASYFDSAYDKCTTIPPMIDARFIADYTGINDMTLREVNDYEFETDIDEFPDD